jgi:hypothetical protein
MVVSLLPFAIKYISTIGNFIPNFFSFFNIHYKTLNIQYCNAGRRFYLWSRERYLENVNRSEFLFLRRSLTIICSTLNNIKKHSSVKKTYKSLNTNVFVLVDFKNKIKRGMTFLHVHFLQVLRKSVQENGVRTLWD